MLLNINFSTSARAKFYDNKRTLDKEGEGGEEGVGRETGAETWIKSITFKEFLARSRCVPPHSSSR